MGTAILFPGQGAQAPALGAPWRHHPAWAVVERAEDATGQPLAELLLEATAERLARTKEAQLAVFAASLLAWEIVKPVAEEVEVVAFAGHSLGQITALVAAGAIPLEAGAKLAARRAEETQAAADSRPGRLAALLGATPEQVEEACAAAPGECWLANDNAPGQLVIGGTPKGVEAASAKASSIGVKRVIQLNVGGAFHTPLMSAAADALAADFDAAPFTDTATPVLSNTDARGYTDAAGWPGRLTRQLVEPVRWASSMETLVELGATTFVEVGPGTTLVGLAKRAVPGITLRSVGIPADAPTLLEA